jgi:hypothetical protein
VCGVTGSFRRILVVAGAVVVLGASGCTGGSGKGPVDPPVLSPTPSSPAASIAPTGSPTGTVEEQILAQYRRFWTDVLPTAEAAAPSQRKSILATVAMEPALSFFVDGIAELDRAGQRGYGHAVPVTETLKRRGGTALVTGCLDGSQAGRRDGASGRILTRGAKSEVVLVTLKVGDDKLWRIYQTGFPETAKC